MRGTPIALNPPATHTDPDSHTVWPTSKTEEVIERKRKHCMVVYRSIQNDPLTHVAHTQTYYTYEGDQAHTQARCPH